jgi:NAD(P)-dependent dehydrogenase (short-subunit alcohol dehydrogenase family)
MRVILFGASGNLGQAVHGVLGSRHEIVRIGRTTGDLHADINDPGSIERVYEQCGAFDAVVSTVGEVHFAALEDFTREQFEIGLRSKLMGQVSIVTLGIKHISAGGSFTLTTGQVNDDPIRFGTSGAMVNGALEGFVHSAAVELPRGLRINLVSPTVIEESWSAFGPYFPGQKPIPSSEAARGYVKSVEGPQTGRVYRMGWSRDQ